MLEKSTEALLRAIERLKVLRTGDLEESYSFCSRVLNLLSIDSTTISEKMQYLDKAIEFGRTGLEFQSLYSLGFVGPYLGQALLLKAELMSSKGERERLLSEAADLTSRQLERFETLAGSDSWNTGVLYSMHALVEAKLAEEKTSQQEKETLLKQSVSDLKKSKDIKAKALNSLPISTVYLQNVGRACESLGNTLTKLYNLSQRRDDCIEAIKAYDEASNYYSQANLLAYLSSNRLEHREALRLYPRVFQVIQCIRQGIGGVPESVGKSKEPKEIIR